MASGPNRDAVWFTTTSQHRRGWLLEGFGWLLFCSGILSFFLAYFSTQHSIDNWSWNSRQIATAGILLVLYVVSGVLLRLGLVLRRRGRRYLARPASEILAADHRPPVVYLRPFNADFRTADVSATSYITAGLTEEEQLERALRPIGPLVAIGQPDEKLPMLGAARIYTSDGDWQGTVLQLIRTSELVLVGLGLSEGLLWEIEQVVRLLPPEKIVLLVLSSPVEYASIKPRVDEIFPKPLPSYPEGKASPEARALAVKGAIYFDPDWTAHFCQARQKRYTV